MFNNKMFIEAMNASFRSVDCKLTVDGAVFLADDIVTLNPYYSGSLLSSVMRCCQVELSMDGEIDYSFAENLKGKKITNVQTAAKNNMLGRQFYPLFENKAYIGHSSWEYSSLMLTTQFEYGVDVTVRVDNDYYYMYVFKIEGDKDVPLSDSYSTVTIPANTPCYISLSRADSMDIEPTEAANITFDAGFTYRGYGEYTIYDSKYVEESNSLQLTCYDRMLDSAVPYDLEIENDTTVRAYLTAICERLGWELSNDPFANENGVITVEAVKSYLPEVIESEDEDENGEMQTTTEVIDSTATFRDVLDDIAELVGGNLLFLHGDNVLCVVYPQPAVIDDELAVLDIDSQDSIHFYETFGPINKVAIIDSEAGDAVTLQDSSSIETNGECCINIVDNPLLNANRESFVGNIFNKLNDISYVCYDFISKCYGYLDFGDIVNIEDRKGNLKKSIILNDSTIFGTAVSETCSAERHSADAETDYSVATPLDKVKVEVKKIMNKSIELSERIRAATEILNKTTDGHAMLIDLKYNSATGRYYIGNGNADTVIVSENPSVATDTEPNDWTTGRIVKINYNGFAVSTTGIAGPYSDFAIYYDEDKKKYCVNADDIAVGTLRGIEAILDEGEIGGFKIGTWLDRLQRKHNGLKKTFPLTIDDEVQEGQYVTFAIDGTSGSSTTQYLLQMFLSDENGNDEGSEYMFALSASGFVECGGVFAYSIGMSDNLYDEFGNILINQKGSHILWSGALYMKASQTANLTERISDQSNGIVLVFSPYIDSIARNTNWQTHFIPKCLVANQDGKGHDILLCASNFSRMAEKYLYIYDNKITGHDNNTSNGTASGITYDNSYFVLRYVIGV